MTVGLAAAIAGAGRARWWRLGLFRATTVDTACGHGAGGEPMLREAASAQGEARTAAVGDLSNRGGGASDARREGLLEQGEPGSRAGGQVGAVLAAFERRADEAAAGWRRWSATAGWSTSW